MERESVINKLWLLNQLKLPHDMIEEISGYCFYDEYSLHIRNNKEMVLYCLKNPFTNIKTYDGYWKIWVNKNNNPLQATNCPHCGNYRFANSYLAMNIICICSRNFEYDETEISIEDIENEMEEYANYREGRAEFIR
jgi:hypothetical protein